MTEHKVTLEQMLDCRERRVERQKEARLRFGAPVVSITLVWPGEVKDSPESRYAMEQALCALDDAFEQLNLSPNFRQRELSVTGPEAIYSVNMDTVTLKRLCTELEKHPLGRLWDMDVIDSDGRPVSRSDIGLPSRRCLLCDQPAHVCARSRAHSVDQLLEAIHRRIHAFKQSAGV